MAQACSQHSPLGYCLVYRLGLVTTLCAMAKSPELWVELLKSKEVIGATHSDLSGFMQGRTNLLIGDCEKIPSTSLWLATQYIPSGTSCGAAIHDFLAWDDMRPLGAITLKWDLPKHDPHNQDSSTGVVM